MRHLKYDIVDLIGSIKTFPNSDFFERIRFLDDESSNYAWCNAAGYNVFDYEEIFMVAEIKKEDD